MRLAVPFRYIPAALLLAAASSLSAQTPAPASAYVPDLTTIESTTASEMRNVVERFSTDRDAVTRRWDTPYSAERRARLREFYAAWRSRLDAMPFDKMSQDGKVDWILLSRLVDHEQDLVGREEKRMKELALLLPFATTITGLGEARRRLEDVDPAAVADTLAKLAIAVNDANKKVSANLDAHGVTDSARISQIEGARASQVLNALRRSLAGWYDYRAGFDPLFTWWVAAPWRTADSALNAYGRTLREKVMGAVPGQDPPIIGDPIGRDALLADLHQALIPYTPEELIAMAEKDFTWSQGEMKKAAREMGLGDDWRAALERVKNDHVAPGDQPDLVRDLAREAIKFVDDHQLVTVPPLARDMWRMQMLSPEAQKESPFFLGGESILVSYPTDSMSEEEKLMSMRGNNRHFARATVLHEVIPGHELQGYANDRYSPQRQNFYTPFYIEGNSFYWETVFWDLGFDKTPEDRIGALFWRMHRSARIILSLGFHLGQRTPQQCIDFLVDSVGHERANATAEVRRWFGGDYEPLYQVAYMTGGFQFRGLRQETVGAGKMTDRDLNDAILRTGPIPVAMVRALIEKTPLTRDGGAAWRFLGEK